MTADPKTKTITAEQCGDCQCLFSCCITGEVQIVRPCSLHEAAPDLLAALVEMVRFLDTRPAGLHQSTIPQYDTARNAIKKARGQS